MGGGEKFEMAVVFKVTMACGFIVYGYASEGGKNFGKSTTK